MKVVTADQMRAMDRRAITEFGVPGAVLMENAGRAVVEVLISEFGALHGRRVVVFCGVGNNGGDGFVIARYLHLARAVVHTVLIGKIEALQGEARTHCDIALHLGLPIDEDPSGVACAKAARTADLIVDAILGTGLHSAPRAPQAAAIAAINAASVPVIAVDLPSGLDADTGAIPGAVVQAMHTVTFAYPKLGMFLYPGAECVGRLHVADIGFDWEALREETGVRLFGSFALTGSFAPAAVVQHLLRRSPDANKGEFGHVGIVAGSQGMVGAPALAAQAAQRAGAGLVTVLTPACAQPLIAGKLNEQMTLPLPEREGAASPEAFDRIAAFAERAAVLCIGPGLTTRSGVSELVCRLLAEIRKPIVLDADGLNILALHPDAIQARKDDASTPLILTPHPGEAARLLGTTIPAVQSDRVGAVRELARRFRATVLLKGRYTLVADPEGAITVNTTGNPGMATGGSGDVLTGVVGALVARGLAAERRPGLQGAERFRALDAVGLAACLHGLAGDLAAQQIGEVGLVAGDLIAHLPQAIRQLEG